MNVEAEIVDEEYNGQNRVVVVEIREHDGDDVSKKTERTMVPYHSTSEDLKKMLNSLVEEHKLDKMIDKRQEEFRQARDDVKGLKVSDDNMAEEVCEHMLDKCKNGKPTDIDSAFEQCRKDKQNEKTRKKDGGSGSK